jgi:hypothetical protein
MDSTPLRDNDEATFITVVTEKVESIANNISFLNIDETLTAMLIPEAWQVPVVVLVCQSVKSMLRVVVPSISSFIS